jgi:hypothetical protein
MMSNYENDWLNNMSLKWTTRSQNFYKKEQAIESINLFTESFPLSSPLRLPKGDHFQPLFSGQQTREVRPDLDKCDHFQEIPIFEWLV